MPYVNFKSTESSYNESYVHMVIIPENRLSIKYYDKIYNPITKTDNIVNILGIIDKQNSLENDEVYKKLLEVVHGFISSSKTDKDAYYQVSAGSSSQCIENDRVYEKLLEVAHGFISSSETDKDSYNQVSAGSSSQCIENDRVYEKLLEVAHGFISSSETDKDSYNQVSAGSSSEYIAILMTESLPPYILSLFEPLPNRDFLLGHDLSYTYD